MTPIPTIPLAVVEYLERIYPDKAPALSDSVDTIRFQAGQVQVHRHLRSMYNDQTKNYASHILNRS